MTSGYYLIVDTTNPLPEHDAYNSAILQVTGKKITIRGKYTVPSADKTIEKVASPTGDTTESNGSVTDEKEKDSATAEIGDVITYQLKTNLPSNLADYDSYNLELEDTLPAGLTFQNISSVKINDQTAVAENYTVTTPNAENGRKLTIEWTNIKADANALAEKSVVVTYTAILNENADTLNGNENTFKVIYSNNPYVTGKGTSETDETKVYTFEVFVYKTDQDDNPLPGAGFIVENSEGKYYQYVEKSNSVQWVSNLDDATEYTSGENGNLNHSFKGLAVGDYKLHENTTPSGYTTAADIPFSINATSKENSDDIDIATTGLGKDKSDNLSITVKNRSGHVLPSTGGIGTTIFYLAGGILVIGAAALLITKKKRNA